MDESELTCTSGEDDTPDCFCAWTEYRLGGEVVRREEYRIEKTAPAVVDRDGVDAEGMVTIDEQDGTGFKRVPAASLVRTWGVAGDTRDYYQPWVEYRRPTDGKVLHRSCPVFLKRALSVIGAVGQAGG